MFTFKTLKKEKSHIILYWKTCPFLQFCSNVAHLNQRDVFSWHQLYAILMSKMHFLTSHIPPPDQHLLNPRVAAEEAAGEVPGVDILNCFKASIPSGRFTCQNGTQALALERSRELGLTEACRNFSLVSLFQGLGHIGKREESGAAGSCGSWQTVRG